ncbi:hypothetical protein I546_4392 [Mycobacterium kansasii 732]|nr:hypothetical protein I546_4392 [Mycobacterium kansasii 732]
MPSKCFDLNHDEQPRKPASGPTMAPSVLPTSVLVTPR